MVARHRKPRHDLIVVLHSKSCDAAEKVVARLLGTRDRRGGGSTVSSVLRCPVWIAALACSDLEVLLCCALPLRAAV